MLTMPSPTPPIPPADTRSTRSFRSFLTTLRNDLAFVWRGLSRSLKISAILAGVTLVILMAFVLVGPVSMRLGAAIGLVGLLIALQVTIMLLLISGQLIPTPATMPNPSMASGLAALRSGEFDRAVRLYAESIEQGASYQAIGAFFALACYLSDDRDALNATLQQSMRQIPPDPARAWLIAGLCIICLTPPPGSELAGILYGILEANPEGQSAWQTEADRFPDTAYGQSLRDLIQTIRQSEATWQTVR